jgi:hypothetical protein
MRSILKTAVVAISVLVFGCQDMGGGNVGGGGDPCNPIYGALAGAALGALVGGAAGEHSGGKKYAIGAAVGAGAGALTCVAFNAYSRQTRSAQQVTQDYGQQHRGQLPQHPVVTAYNVNVNPVGGVQPGNTAAVDSNMTIVDGTAQPANEIKEALTLSGPNGDIRHEKVVNQGTSGGGAYQNEFKIKLPSGVAPGAYKVTTQLYVNGQMLAQRQQNLQVVAGIGGLRVALR